MKLHKNKTILVLGLGYVGLPLSIEFSKKFKTIGFSNFSGGFLDKNSDISIHSKVNNYGVGEDINHILMHLLMQFIAKTNLNIENIKNKKIIL